MVGFIRLCVGSLGRVSVSSCSFGVACLNSSAPWSHRVNWGLRGFTLACLGVVLFIVILLGSLVRE